MRVRDSNHCLYFLTMRIYGDTKGDVMNLMGILIEIMRVCKVFRNV